MATKLGKPRKIADSRRKLSLYPLSVEDALRAAAQTGRPPSANDSKAAKRRRVRGRPPICLYRLPPGEYDKAALNAIEADFILLQPGEYRFLPPQILFEDVRLAASAPKRCTFAIGLVRFEATEQGPTAAVAQVEVLTGRLASTDDSFALKVRDDWFFVCRRGEQALIERLGSDRHRNDTPTPVAEDP